MAEIVKQLESSLAVNLALGVSALDRVCMVLADELLLDDDRLEHIQLHKAIVGRRVDRLVWVVALILLLLVALVIVLVPSL